MITFYNTGRKEGVCDIWSSEPIPSYHCPKQWGAVVFIPQQTLPRYAILEAMSRAVLIPV